MDNGYLFAIDRRGALDRSVDPVAGLLSAGVVLRLRADLEWLEECERMWTERGWKAGRMTARTEQQPAAPYDGLAGEGQKSMPKEGTA